MKMWVNTEKYKINKLKCRFVFKIFFSHLVYPMFFVHTRFNSYNFIIQIQGKLHSLKKKDIGGKKKKK